MLSRVAVLGSLMLLSLGVGCNREKSAAPAADQQSQAAATAPTSAAPSTQTPAGATAPTSANAPSPKATPPAAAAPAASPPSTPVPSFSAAKKIGMFAYPKNKQTSDQQLRDEYDCYNLAQQQTGVNPDTAAPVAPTAAEMQAAQQQGASQAEQVQGGRVRGAARGAAGGAVIGAIAGDAGKGAAIGATAGTMRGGLQQRRANAMSKDQAAQTAGAQEQQQYEQAKAAYSQQMGTLKRSFSACMDARHYSVQ